MQAAAASRNTAEVVSNENVELAAVDSPEVVVEETGEVVNGVEGGGGTKPEQLHHFATNKIRLTHHSLRR
ncbi:hypothetical protein [Pseudobutyrivibrio ruminis]|uniref:hypothetical protein n=1 Tax=Pseudobutyrivibrio ruminis TaxID=46206 RepID=UPI001A9A485A|nr:hypothetical protein [Pseudobutyrivibrio ruminis]